MTRILHESGGLVVGGTGCRAWSYLPPGFALLREIEPLAEAIGAMAAVKADTSISARDLRQQENIRSVAAGHYADFLVIDGDPLHDPRALRRLPRRSCLQARNTFGASAKINDWTSCLTRARFRPPANRARPVAESA